MLEITIEDTETGEGMHRTTKLAAICALGEDGVYSLVQGSGTARESVHLAWAMDSARDAMLGENKKTQLMYRLRDMIESETEIRSAIPGIFNEG